jgi:hypothetical protein
MLLAFVAFAKHKDCLERDAPLGVSILGLFNGNKQNAAR